MYDPPMLQIVSRCGLILFLSSSALLPGALFSSVAHAQESAGGLKRGMALAKKRSFREALTVLNAVIVAEKDNAEALRWRGHCFAGLGEHAKALRDLDSAVALDDKNAWGFYARGVAHQELGRAKEAVSDFTRALALEPTNFKALQWRGQSRSAVGDHLGAFLDFSTALGQQPKNVWLLHARGRAAASLLSFERAKKDFEAAILQAVDDPDHHAQLGYLLVAMGEERQALAALDVAHRLDPLRQDYVRLWRYWLQGRVGKLTGSSADALPRKKWPGDLAKVLLGELTSAQVLLRLTAYGFEGKGLRAKRCEAHFYLGVRALLVGRLNRAQSLFKEALVLGGPTIPEWRAARVLVRRR